MNLFVVEAAPTSIRRATSNGGTVATTHHDPYDDMSSSESDATYAAITAASHHATPPLPLIGTLPSPALIEPSTNLFGHLNRRHSVELATSKNISHEDAVVHAFVIRHSMQLDKEQGDVDGT